MSVLKNYIETLTLDNGLAFADHQTIAQRIETDIYFAHSYTSWERGTNENANGLIRQYFPKDSDFSQITDKQIKFVMQ